MIKFELTHLTPDLNGIHQYHYNEVYFSAQNGSLTIPALKRGQLLSLEISPQGKLVVISTSPFTINSIKKNDRAYIEKGQLLGVNDFHLKLIDFQKTPPFILKNLVNHKVDHLLKNDPHLINIMKKIKG